MQLNWVFLSSDCSSLKYPTVSLLEINIDIVLIFFWSFGTTELIHDIYKNKNSTIAPDRRGYPHNIFLISPQNHMLWIPHLMNTTTFVFMEKKGNYIYFSVEKKQHLIWCYDFTQGMCRFYFPS